MASNHIIGPQLPSHLEKAREGNTESGNSCFDGLLNDKESSNTGALAKGQRDFYGPVLPPELSPSNSSNLYGPVLPPTLNLNKNKSKTIGPVLPPGFSATPLDSVAPQTFDDSSNDSCIGPSLSELFSPGDSKEVSCIADFERRAENMKKKLTETDQDGAQKREEWMIELPSVVGNKIGIGARSFNKRAGPSLTEEDRSGWTQTPLDKKRKNDDDRPPALTSEQIMTIRKNEELALHIEEFNKKKRNESLMDQHKKNLKKKEKDEKQVRREFDRDKDLNAKQVDKAFTKSIADKAKMFNSRFSHGSNHFL